MQRLLTCRCRDLHCVLALDYDPEFGLSLLRQVRAHGLWCRLKAAWHVLFRGCEPTWHDVIVGPKGADEMRAWLAEAERQGYGTDWDYQDRDAVRTDAHRDVLG